MPTGSPKSSKPPDAPELMRILINAASAKRGGIVTYTENLVPSMVERGLDVKVAAPPDYRTSLPSTLVPVTAGDYGPMRRVAWEQIVWRRIVAKQAPDVLFSSANFGLFYSPVPQVLLMREGGLFDPLYLSHVAPEQGIRVQTIRHFRRNLMLTSTRHADHVVTPSAAMRDNLVAWDASLASRISVDHYGARHDLFTSDRRVRTWREDGRLRLLYVSVYYPHKCPHVICEAVSRLNDAGRPATSTITMTREELETTRGAALDRVVMTRAEARGELALGHHAYEDLPALYASHDVFVFPSVSETFGHPMVEAMASGVPIVAADTPINREICGDGALYFRPFSPSDLIARLDELENDVGLRQRLAESARKSVVARFSWDQHVDGLVRIFEDVLAERPGKRRPRT